MINLIPRGYIVGGGLISPDDKFFFLNIPKNASTFMSMVLHQNNWYYANLSEFKGKTVICLLRDPLERWISGMATYSGLYLLGKNYNSSHFIADYNNLTEKLIFDNIVFDDHTVPQSDFINCVPNDKDIVYFSMKANSIIKVISDYLGYSLTYDPSITNQNSTDSNHDTKQITDFLKSQMTQEHENKIRIKYKQDYQLLNNAG